MANLSANGEPINCGAGSGVSIRQLAGTIGRVAGFEGKLVFDTEKPDGTPHRVMDSSRLAARREPSFMGLRVRLIVSAQTSDRPR
jgi:nucleoside-diphosphate-sugar epimerase